MRKGPPGEGGPSVWQATADQSSESELLFELELEFELLFELELEFELLFELELEFELEFEFELELEFELEFEFEFELELLFEFELLSESSRPLRVLAFFLAFFWFTNFTTSTSSPMSKPRCILGLCGCVPAWASAGTSAMAEARRVVMVRLMRVMGGLRCVDERRCCAFHQRAGSDIYSRNTGGPLRPPVRPSSS
jgi:hypothetical protein